MQAIENEFLAFSANKAGPAVVEVLEGEVEYSTQRYGPFQAEGKIRQGMRRTFDKAGVLLGKATVDVMYPESEEHKKRRLAAQATYPAAPEPDRETEKPSEEELRSGGVTAVENMAEREAQRRG